MAGPRLVNPESKNMTIVSEMLPQRTFHSPSATCSSVHVPSIKFDQRLHTFSRLVDQIDSVMKCPRSPLLIGSLGRVAVLGSQDEFRIRGETPARTARK